MKSISGRLVMFIFFLTQAIKALSNLYTLMGEEEKACRIFEEKESAVNDFR